MSRLEKAKANFESILQGVDGFLHANDSFISDEYLGLDGTAFAPKIDSRENLIISNARSGNWPSDTFSLSFKCFHLRSKRA